MFHQLSKSAALQAPVTAASQTSFSQPLSRARLDKTSLLGSFSSGKSSVTNTVGRGNPTDLVEIDLAANSRMRLKLNNRSNTQIKALLFDADGKAASIRNGRARLGAAGGKQAETVFKGLQPGTYYLQIQSAPKGTNQYKVDLFINRTGGPEPLPCGCGAD